MSGTEIIMLVLGFVVGLCLGGIYCHSLTRTIGNELHDLRGLVDKQYEILNDKYDGLDSLNAENMKLMDDTVQRLVNVSERIFEKLLNDGKQTLELIEKYGTINGKLLEATARYLKESEEVNTSRWELIEEYILNEDDQKTDYCVTCRNNNQESADVCLRCSEGALFQYDPEHVYLQTQEEKGQ